MKKIKVKQIYERCVTDIDEIKTLGDFSRYVEQYKNYYDIEMFAKDNDIWLRMITKD